VEVRRISSLPGFACRKALVVALQSLQGRQPATREGNDSISQVLCRHHTRSTNNVQYRGAGFQRVKQGDNDMDQFDKMLAKYQPAALSLFRFITGLLLFQYGVAKLFKFPAIPMFAKVELMSLYGAAGSLELILGGLLMVGLFTRPVAFILAGEMAFAYFLGHMFRDPANPVFLPLLNRGTEAILFCFACLYLATAGGGPYSVDAMRKK
jgi:putative oxidoreductase